MNINTASEPVHSIRKWALYSEATLKSLRFYVIFLTSTRDRRSIHVVAATTFVGRISIHLRCLCKWHDYVCEFCRHGPGIS